ncbi:MAG TPA: hypothetical protein VHX59_05080 [Mycobacteriales bacterium]|jgi:hypothetical protein|nr:hypothetical protein [Mycobacteriales bacterium]
MTQPSGRPPRKRVVITAPRSSGARVGSSGRLDLGEQTRLGDILIRSLIRTQLHLAIRLAGLIGVLLGSLPLALAYLPAIRRVHVFGLPLSWLLLGVLVYPVLIGGAALYVRQAERNERDFEDFVDHS